MLYPVLTPSRCLMDLCGTWEFQQDLNNEGFDQKWYAGPLPSPITMPVPASYNDIKEDENKKLQDEVQKLTDRYIASLEKELAVKEKELMTV